MTSMTQEAVSEGRLLLAIERLGGLQEIHRSTYAEFFDDAELLAQAARELLALRSSTPEPVAWTNAANLAQLEEHGSLYFACMNHQNTAEWNIPLYASPPHPSRTREAEGVAVKPLEWASEPPYSVARVPNLRLFYSTEAVWTERKFHYVELSGGFASGRFDTVAEAKAAAQADYEQRIRSALASPDTVGVEITEEMVEAACIGYWPSHWPQSMDKADMASIRVHMRNALAAALQPEGRT